MKPTARRIILTVSIILVFVLGLSIGQYVLGVPSTVNYIEPNTFREPYSYEIFRNSTTTSCVKNCSDGTVLYSDTNDTTVFTTAEGYVYDNDGGGTVFVKAGTYNINRGTIVNKTNVCWKGDGSAATIIKSSEAVGYIRLGPNSIFEGFTLNYTQLQVYGDNVTIKNNVIKDYAPWPAIQSGYGTFDIEILNNKFYGSQAVGTYAIYTGPWTFAQIRDNVIDSADYGIYISANPLNFSLITGNTIRNATNGIRLNGPSSSRPILLNQISSNIIYNCSYGLYLNQYCYNNTISNNIITNCSTYGIAFANGNNWGTLICQNQLRFNTANIDDKGNATKIIANPGYNPVGYISSPILAGGTYVLSDTLGHTTVSNATKYTCWGSPKNIFICNGTFSGSYNNITVNGQVISGICATGPTMMIHLEPGDYIIFSWATTPVFKVMGE